MEDATESTTPTDVTAESMAAIFTGPVEGRDYQEMPAERFTHGLIYDVVQVLEKHGYKQPPEVDGDKTDRHRALGQTVSALLELVETYEGKRL